jgi:hypothetical protein
VRAHLVVVVDEAIQLALELLGAGDVLHGQDLHGLVEALDLSAAQLPRPMRPEPLTLHRSHGETGGAEHVGNR